MLIFISCTFNVCAKTEYGFETVNLSKDKVSNIWKNLNVKLLPNTEFSKNEKMYISSFDVSSNGKILIGFKNRKIAVMDDNKKVLHFLEFSDTGSFYVKWNGNNILLLLVRGSVIVEFSVDGKLVNMIMADDKSAENNSLWNKQGQRKKIVNGNKYIIKNNLGVLNIFSSYSQLIKIDTAGNAVKIYDKGNLYVIGIITILIFIIFSVGVIVWGCYKKYIIKNSIN